MDPNMALFTMEDFVPSSMPNFSQDEVASASAAASEGSGTVGGNTSSSTGPKRSRTSSVWQHFEEVIEEHPDGTTVRHAKCKICKKLLSGKSSGGTGHLGRHIASCAKKQGVILRQTQLMLQPDGTVRSWDYDPQVARESLTRLIARQDLPLNFGETEAFEKYIKSAHNPRFEKVSRRTTTRDLKKVYSQGIEHLKELFSTCTFSVSITSDIWSGRAKQDYLSVVAHFIDDDWQIQKRIMGLRLIDVSHTADNIAERISLVIEEFGLTNKIFAVTLDNAAANSKAMDILDPLFNTYAESFLLHQRCACHIINLIVKSGFKRISAYLDVVREAISWINSSNTRVAAFKRFCIASNVRPRKFGTDAEHRWNATYLMLKHLLPYKDVVTVFIQAQNVQIKVDNVFRQLILTQDVWYVVQKFYDFLEIFYDCTVLLSGVYYPTSCEILHSILQIATVLRENENDAILGEAVFHMKKKYLKYWRDIPMLYSFASILDPRVKLRGLINLLSVIGEVTNIDYSNYCGEVRVKLNQVFRKYENKFQGVRRQRPPPGPTAGKKKNWNVVWGGSSSSSAGGGSSSTTTTHDSEISVELSSYLDSDAVRTEAEDFSILGWWNAHKLAYPVLSRLARDVLTVPVSTTSSEAAFSLCGRIIEERRTCLSSELVEMLLIMKDWELAEERAQHTAENLELETQFKNLYLDETEEQE